MSEKGYLQHLARGGELLRADRVEEARAELEAALSLKPGDEKVSNLLGLAYFRLGQYADALRIYQGLVGRRGEDASLHLNLGLVHLKMGAVDEAIRELDRARELDPSQARTLGYLGLAYARKGEYARAREAFLKAGQEELAREMEQVLSPSSGRASSNGADRAVAVGEIATPSGSAPALAPVAGSAPAFDPLPESANPSAPAPAAPAAPAVVGAGPEAPAVVGAGPAPAAVGAGPAPAVVGAGPAAPAVVGAPPAPAVVGAASALAAAAAPAVVGAGPAAPAVVGAGPAAPAVVGAGPAAPAVVGAPPAPAPVGAAAAGGAPLASPAGARSAATDGVVAALRAAQLPVPAEAAIGAGEGHATPMSVTSFATSRLIRPDDGNAPFEIAAGGTLIVRVRGRLFSRTEGVVVSGGELAYEPATKRMRGRATDEPFGSESRPMFLVSGHGHLVASPRGGRFTAIHLSDDIVYLREDLVFAFEEGLRWENGGVPGSGGSIHVVQFRGEGCVALRTRRPPLSVKLAPEKVLYVDVDVLAGWIGRVVPRLVAPAAGGDASTPFVECTGEGVVLIEEPEAKEAP